MSADVSQSDNGSASTSGSVVSERLISVAREQGHHPAYVFGHEKLSFADLLDHVQRLSASLRARGIGPGDRVATLMRNHPNYFVVSHAIWYSGAVLVPVNVLLSTAEIEHVIRDSGAKTLVFDDAFEDVAAHCQTQLGVLDLIGHGGRLSQSVSVDELIATGGTDEAPSPLGDERLAVIAYTSGTTGFPKGAMLDDGHLLEWMLNARDHLLLTTDDNFLQVLPVHSVAPCIIGGWLTSMVGSTCVVLAAFDASEVAHVIAADRVAGFAMVPTMLFDLLRVTRELEPDFSSLRFVQAGGAAVPDVIRESLATRFGVPMIKSYGSTECSYVSLDRLGVEPRAGASGQVMAHIKLTVRDAMGAELPRGEIGELCVGPREDADVARPFRPILGYWQDEEKTAQSLVGGEFRTGDLGYVDEDDFVYVVDRLKDMIIRGGNNIYPAELERVLMADPRVESAFVVGAPNERLGEVPYAFIVTTSWRSDLELDDILKSANANLARFKRIEGLQQIASDALPKNAMNKVLKSRLIGLIDAEDAAALQAPA